MDLTNETTGSFDGSTIIMSADTDFVEIPYAPGMFDNAPKEIEELGQKIDTAVSFLNSEGFDGQFIMSNTVCLGTLKGKESRDLPSCVAAPICVGITYLFGPRSFMGEVYEFEDISKYVSYPDHLVFDFRINKSTEENKDLIWGTFIFKEEPFVFVGSYDWQSKNFYDREGKIMSVPYEVAKRFSELQTKEKILEKGEVV